MNPNYVQCHSNPSFEPPFRIANGVQTTSLRPQNIQQTKSISHDPQIISIYKNLGYQPFPLLSTVVPMFSEQQQEAQQRQCPVEQLQGSCACSCTKVKIFHNGGEHPTYMKVLLKKEMRIMGNQEGILAKAQVT